MQSEIKRQLYELIDRDYQKFSQKLNPDGKNILGIRLPNLRKIAKQIAKSDWENYLRTATDDSFEEILLQGLVIGYIRIPIEGYLQLIKDFIPKIDNWATCDTFCGTIKISSKNSDIVWNFLQQFFRDDRPFFLRFALVMLFKFIDKEHIASIFTIISKIHSDNRYVKLAIAWLTGECCVYFSEQTINFLESKVLDPYVQNIAIRKITESFRIPFNVKIWIKQCKPAGGLRLPRGAPPPWLGR
ncbi:MAG: DNA alkylation repair protein [Puniceicoccales bacterium]|jgi:3-methyladenine DNA glycosylase AlkD|nr:DNA alkylation repair protein [Puniceicoccales bacterium]